MRKILCILFAMGVSILSFAGKNDNNQKQLSNSEFMTKVSEDLIKVAAIIPELEQEVATLKKDTSEYKKRITILNIEKQGISRLLSSPEACTMFVEYPLSIKYDSALVELSKHLIKQFKISETKENKDYIKLMLPYLNGYHEYNEEIYTLISEIKKIYFGVIDKKYPKEQFEKDINKTKFYKRCKADGIDGIPYLNKIIRRVQEQVSSENLSKEFLEDILSEIK